MDESKFSEHWAQAQFCYFRAEATKSTTIKCQTETPIEEEIRRAPLTTLVVENRSLSI